jgi:predicted nucleic acid-binding protein
VQLVIADTGPVNYLILIGHIDLLPALFESVILPSAVQAELSDPDAPPPVRNWIADPPEWLEIRNDQFPDSDPALKALDEGEKAAIALAGALHADLLLIDDREGVQVARRKGIPVTGTLGVLDRAAECGLVDFGQAIRQLDRTNFHRPEKLLDALLKRHEGLNDG